MFGGGFFVGGGGTASAGITPRPMPSGLSHGVVGHLEAGASGGVPVSFPGQSTMMAKAALLLREAPRESVREYSQEVVCRSFPYWPRIRAVVKISIFRLARRRC